MLYLTRAELKGGYPFSPKEWIEIVLRSMEDVVNYRKEGKVVLHVAYAGRQGGSIIWDLESHDELMQILSQLPFWPFLEWEIIPLISTEQTMEGLKRHLASVQE